MGLWRLINLQPKYVRTGRQRALVTVYLTLVMRRDVLRSRAEKHRAMGYPFFTRAILPSTIKEACLLFTFLKATLTEVS